jgi:hypothetical protein
VSSVSHPLHASFYEGAELLTPPVVYNAALLRSISRAIDTRAAITTPRVNLR